MGFLQGIGVSPSNVVFSSDTSEEQGREYGKGLGTVDCCYPVKAKLEEVKREYPNVAEMVRQDAFRRVGAGAVAE